MGVRALIRADGHANALSGKGRAVTAAFRLTAAARSGGGHLVGRIATTVYRVFVDWVMGIDLPPDVQVGPGLAIFHGTGLVVHSSTIIGSDVLLRHGVTLGALGEGDAETTGPRIGDRVRIGAGAIVLGPIDVGDDAVIGAGAVVVRDVPPGATVVGNPARVVATTAGTASTAGSSSTTGTASTTGTNSKRTTDVGGDAS